MRRDRAMAKFTAWAAGWETDQIFYKRLSEDRPDSLTKARNA